MVKKKSFLIFIICLFIYYCYYFRILNDVRKENDDLEGSTSIPA